MAQSGDIGINWNQILGMMVGAASTASIFIAYAWTRRRRKIARNERPPQQTKILRPPGYSLHCQIDDLSEKFSFAVMQSVLAGATFGMICSGFYPLIEGLVLQRFTYAQMSAPPRFYLIYASLLLAMSTLAWLIASVVKAVQHHRLIQNYRFGLRGEQAVAEALADASVAEAGYVVFHDVPGDGAWNVDHIVIGPGGIFVLETKTRPRRTPTRKQPDQQVWFDGKKLQFPWCYDCKAVGQAERNAGWVKEFVAGFAPKNIVVQPVVVVPGWFVEPPDGNWPVKAMNAAYLAKHLAIYSKRRFTSAELQPLIRRFDERCRDLEF
ncbi:MAG: nuclease-related domain-containing protein [Verrucomicrobiae bacterium]|nr:nuclease-related domain-containing protein [Verrucomicrobiae bacterium]